MKAKVDTPLLDNPLCAQCGEPLRPRPVRVNGRVIWRRPPKYCSTRCRSAAAAAERPGVWEANRRAVAELAAECRRRNKTALELIRGNL